MPGISGVNSQTILNSLVRNQDNNSHFSILLSAKLLQVQKDDNSAPPNTIDTASSLRTPQVDLRV